jgi:hypothetical protein
MSQQTRMPDVRGGHRDLVVGLRMAEIDHFVDRQKPRIERSWARALWPHTHTLVLKRLAAEGTRRLRFRFDEQELASGAGLMRVRDAIVACNSTSTSGAAVSSAQSAVLPFRAFRLYSRREIFHRADWLPSPPLVHRFRLAWRRAAVGQRARQDR